MEKEGGILSIFIDLLNKNNKKFVVFSIFLIIILLLFANIFLIDLYDFFGSSYNGSNIYTKYDITGNSEFLQILLLVVLGIIIGVACYNSFKYPKEGVNFNLNRILGISFIIFAIFPIFAFNIVRGEEEKVALEYKDNLLQEVESKSNKKGKSELENKLLELMNEIEAESDGSREMEIAMQISSEENKDKFSNDLLDGFLWEYQRYFFILKRFHIQNDLSDSEIIYYCTYFQMSLISSIAGVFYLINSINNTKNIE